MEPKRIRHACSRCRRQKLRCDYERPCPLCVRAGADCTEATQRTWRTNRPKSAAYQARQRKLEEQRNSNHQTQARHGVLSTQDASATDSGLPSPSYSSTTHIAPEDVIPSGQRASALHLVGTIFQRFHALGSNHNHKVDAIPASESPENGSDATQSEMVPVVDLIGIPFPSLDVVTALLDSYKDSVHWYIRVLHEPSLREKLAPIMESGLAPRSQRPLLLLALMMMILGARFVSDQACERINRETPLADLTSKMLIACERWFLPSMDCVTVDTVIYAYLLAAHYLCNRQTRAAFLTLGTTVRAAQSIGLNRESQWGEVSDIERETRRCAWWSVFIGAGFISMSWGTPPMLSEADCQVRHPTDVEDACNLEQCPGFGSLEKREDGEIRPVTVGSYNRYKAEMYKIAITIMRRVYFTKYRNPEELTQLISKLHQRLLTLEKSIPPELRVESHTHNALQGGRNQLMLRKIFAVQALTLQVSYDNMQIFLFRPLISVGGIPRSLAGTRENSPGLTNQTNLGNVPSLLLKIAQNQCWTSAMRTSMVGQSSDIMKLSQFIFPAVHVGVHTFSAGVMLGLLALTSPLSAHGQESKRAIAKIIQVPKVARLKTHVWGQMTQILTDLMHVIAAEETKALIAGVAGDGSKETLAEPEVFGQPSNPYEDLGSNPRTEDAADGESIAATEGTDFDEPGTLRIHLPTAVEGSMCEMAQTLHSSGPFMTGVEDQQAQYSAQSDVFDASNLWLPQQPADPLQMMDQLWIWDGSFSHFQI